VSHMFWVPFVVGVAPLAVLFAILFWQIRVRSLNSKLPLTSHLLRPPGESLRKKIEILDERFTNQFLLIFICCVWIGFMCWLGMSSPFPWIPECFAVVGLGTFVIFAIRLNATLHLLKDYQLGFLGERAIGEELNQLLAHGWKVFHDVEFNENPSQKPFNVDHVVVGSGGVFAIETKTRRKRVNRHKNDVPNIVTYDGARLQYPWGTENFGVRQARDGAVHLSGWLTSKLKETVTVQAVLALPGWSVSRKAGGDLSVISGKEIASLFRGEHRKAKISLAMVNAIVALLDQKCRDVGKD